jgi:predicted SAM-dependent methyltransferase
MENGSKTSSRITRPEYLFRQLALKHVAPVALKVLDAASQRAQTRLRRSFAIQRHAQGSGIEVGAAVSPSVVPVGSSVQYVDKFDVEALRNDPELVGFDPVVPDILDSAESLSTVATDSQDFVLAFSVFEHVEDPLHTIEAFHRVTRSGGKIVISVPDKRFMGDRNRPLTTFDHLVRDYREGPIVSRSDHFREVGVTWFNMSGAELDTWVRKSVESTTTHTHFHVWDADAYLEFLLAARKFLGIKYEVVEFAAYGHEALSVLKVTK